MKCKIEGVIIFTNNKEKNEVKFNSGLNIISGVSQTGKSAIIEIIDYCLASTTTSIPKGIIIDNSILYSIILDIDDSYIILGRRAFYYGDKLQIGKSKMFTKIEPKKYFSCENINYQYFEDNKFCYRPLDDAKKEIENLLGISVYKQSVYEGDEVKSERVSIRNMVPFLFQHQNLVANKFALFYRFDDSMKRRKTIMEFPIFMGLVDQEYYNILQNKESKEKGLKNLEKEIKLDKEFNNKISVRISDDIKEYYKLIGKDIKDKEIDDILSGKKTIDKLLIEEIDIENSLKIYNELESELKEVNSKVYVLQNQIENIDITLNSGHEVEKIIRNVNTDDSDVDKSRILRCPFCDSQITSLTDKIKRIDQCKKVLNNSLKSISVIKKEHLKQEKDILEGRIKNYKEKQLTLRNEIKDIKLKHEKIQGKVDFKELIIEKRIRIENDLDKLEASNFNKSDSIKYLRDEIEILKEKLEGYDLEKELNQIECTINIFMNKIAEKLDFEELYKPINLKFDSKNFDLYQYQEGEREKIFLSSMGSGSNWLTCHLALFIGLHYCFAKLGKKCSIPSVLILDQPSQIYFPNISDKEKDIDIISVENIYKTLDWAIKYIKEKTKQKIQIIVLDHVSGLEFEDKKFDDFIRKRWNEKGNGLIEKENINI